VEISTYYGDLMSSLISVREAAEALSVTTTQVYRLIEGGQLRGTRLGTQQVVFAEALNEYRLVRPQRGRPLDAAAAWSSLLGQQPLEIDQLGPIAASTRRRATATYCYVPEYRLSAIAASLDTVVTGAEGARLRGAAIGNTKPLQVYVNEQRWPAVRREHRISDAGDDVNLIVRVVPRGAWHQAAASRPAPLIVCAVDAYSCADLRSAHEALEAMKAGR
jgi:excisionase family DNA binding protein